MNYKLSLIITISSRFTLEIFENVQFYIIHIMNRSINFVVNDKLIVTSRVRAKFSKYKFNWTFSNENALNCANNSY